MKLGSIRFYWLNSWVMASIVYLATREFCIKFIGNVRNLGVGYENSGESAFILPSNLIQKRGTKVSVILFQ